MYLDKAVFLKIWDRIYDECKDRNVSGFLIIADLMEEQAFFRIINRESVLRQNDGVKQDANFAAIAAAKFGTVFAHLRDSQSGASQFYGEPPYKGGHISEDKRFVYAFSGAPQEVDLELMQIAEALHRELS